MPCAAHQTVEKERNKNENRNRNILAKVGIEHFLKKDVPYSTKALPLRQLFFMQRHAFIFLVFCLLGVHGYAQNFVLSGEIRDAKNGESLIGAVVQAQGTTYGALTNTYGNYSLSLPKGKYTVEFRYIGYETKTIEVNLTQHRRIDLELAPISMEFGPVVVEGTRKSNVNSTEMGKIDLPIDQIKKIPVIFGEVDILKTITLLPGVQSSGEGNAGFYVRGGGADQNLILLDNAPVYNASHLFGFFSVFNADAVKSIELTKGGMPASYGGRLSSVLDINLKEGNSKSFHAQGGIGTIASRFTVEGPIKKDTSSFIISARRTYIDVLLKPFTKNKPGFGGTGYHFYDLNAKFNYRLSNKDQLFVSGYFGRDVFAFSSKSAGFSASIPWGNSTATLRWKRSASERIFWNAILTFTDYQFQFAAKQDAFSFAMKSGIRDYGAKVQWSFFPNNLHKMKWGVDYTFHKFTPNNTSASSGDVSFDLGEQVKLYSHETAVYFQDEFDLNERWKINAGLRIPYFMHVGPFTRYVHLDNTSVIGGPAQTTAITYDKGAKVKDYLGYEPRINVRFAIDKNSSIKMGLTRNMQFIHLTSLSPSSLPTDVWLPSTDVLRPQVASQAAVGYFRNLFDDKWEASVECYYKDMRNQSEYKEGASPDQTVGDNIDNLLVFGRGYSYGAEFFLKKRFGDLSGWIGYTYSKTMRVFNAINNGNPFPSRWDRRHDGNFVLTYSLNERVDFGFVFVYATGNAVTLPVARYFFEGNVVDIYGSRNSYRMAPYHRADVSVNVKARATKKQYDPLTETVIEVKKKTRSSWNFSVYNVYNRMNPYFIYFATEATSSGYTIQAKQVSLFPILPSVTWNFEF